MTAYDRQIHILQDQSHCSFHTRKWRSCSRCVPVKSYRERKVIPSFKLDLYKQDCQNSSRCHSCMTKTTYFCSRAISETPFCAQAPSKTFFSQYMLSIIWLVRSLRACWCGKMAEQYCSHFTASWSLQMFQWSL